MADDGTVRVTDIAVNTLVRQATNKHSLSIPSNWMYKSREELEWATCTTQTDVYSFATTIYSVYTLKPPFPSNNHSYGRDLMQIINEGHDGIFGKCKPEEMSDGLWEMIRKCWEMDPSRRPSMSEVDGMLAKMCGAYN